MFRKLAIAATIIFSLVLSGCASVPMANKENDLALKQFSPPPEDKAGLYIYRNTFVGQALKKTVSLDGNVIGETANKVYFYKVISPGPHTLATESEFSDNSISFEADAGKHYYAEQYIKVGVFVGGANLKMVEEEEARKAILECSLAEEASLADKSAQASNR
ncbi:DUF2846 domain-containing protein [Methylophaga sp. OBS4]|uniref:DUF2846 domain-containing protein n=1 Tax=Methylophaga sp. OBS4 TaxID=2991935 RepID=UPI0022578539|nr:DUF2846 domain-containing protein [Methylophaga sp. OBS4]MCX4186542.1 DUF2846 domain-containing protein [Methylophaga sp. OBS4]